MGRKSNGLRASLWFAIRIRLSRVVRQRHAVFERESPMKHISPARLGLHTAAVFALAGLLAACTAEPPKPAPLVGMNAPVAAPVGEIGTPVVSEPPVAAPPLGGQTARRQVAQSRPAQEVRSSKPVVSAKERHRVTKARHHKATKHIAHKGSARKHVKVTGPNKATHPKT